MNRNEFYTALSDYNDAHSLKHYGAKGQKWGVRRYQNEDGSLTPAGREHYGYGNGNSDTKDYSNNEKGLAVIPGDRFVANSIRKKALDKKIENGKKLGRFEQKYAAEKLTIALKNDDKEMVDKLKNVLTSEEYDKAEERSQKLWNKRSIVKKAQKDRDKKKAEYEENLKKDPEHTHKYKSQDMNLAESMSDGTNRYKSINSYSDKSKNIEDSSKSGKKSERRAAFDESTRVTGKEEAEAWKKLADY